MVVINAVVGHPESKAEAALEGLRSLVRTHATVIRDGHCATVPSDEIVPGDLVLLESGDKVPADLPLTREAELRVNESALTCESVPAAKDEVVLPEAVPVADRRNMAYSGTLVTTGSGAGIVVATGAETELGAIHRLVGAAETLATPGAVGEFPGMSLTIRAPTRRTACRSSPVARRNPARTPTLPLPTPCPSHSSGGGT